MRLIRLVILFILSAILGACGGGGGSSSTIITPIPGGSVTTTLNLAKDSLDPSISETTTVTAIFATNGVPIAGMPVQFSATPGYATLNPADGKVTTDVTGTATIVLQVASAPPAEGVGQLTVSAVYNGTNITKTTLFYVNKTSLKLGSIVVNPKVNAGTSTIVVVPILNADGTSYTAQDVDVYFSAVNGSFIADNLVGKVRSSGGFARVTYVAPYSTSTQIRDTLTATLGTATSTGTVLIDPRKASNIQYASSVPAKTSFGYRQSVTVSYKVTDSMGSGIRDTPVSFTISGSPAGATLKDQTPTSDAYGYVSATLLTGSSPTTLWVTASLSDGTSAQSAVFTVTPTQILSIATVSPTAPVTIGSNINLPVSFKVTDATGAGVIGQTVVFTVIDNKGSTSTAATVQQTSVVTDAQGNVATTLVSKTTAANLWVKATLQSSATLFATTGMITVQSSDEGTVELALSSLSPNAGDTIMAMVKFTSQSPPPYSTSTQVIIKSDNPVVIAAETSTNIDSMGNAFIPLKVLGAGRANIYAQIGNSMSLMNIVTATSGSGGTPSLTLTVSPNTAKAGDTVFATVAYTNTATTSLAGQTITIRSNNSAIADNTYTGITDSTGKVVISLPVSALAQNSIATLYASGAGTVSATVPVTISSSGGAGSLALAVSPNTAKAGDTVFATVAYTNAGATTLAGQTITIRSNNSAAIADNIYTGITDSTGKAVISVPVSATAQNSIITLYASGAGTVSATTPVTITNIVTGASLEIAVKATGTPGEVLTVTATYKNPNASTLAGMPVSITSSRPDVIPNSALPVVLTDARGLANINLTVASGAYQDVLVSLFGSTTGSVNSTVANVTITQAIADVATLTLTVSNPVFNLTSVVSPVPPATAFITSPAGRGGIVVQGNQAVFKTAQGIPIVNQPIIFNIMRVDGWQSGDTVTLNGHTFTNSATPPDTETVKLTTDTTGTVLMPTVINGNYPAVAAVTTNSWPFVIYWRAVTTYIDPVTKVSKQYIAYGSSLCTFSHTGI